MTQAKISSLINLLQEVIDEGCRLPDGVWELVNQLVSWAAPEMVIVSGNMQKVLLQHRKDDPEKEKDKILRPEYRGRWSGWDGFHFDGGYMRPLESIQDACNRMAWEVGISKGVEILGGSFIRKWLDHPYAFPVSLGVVCTPIGVMPERADLKLFSKNDIPRVEDFLHPSHHEFLVTYFRQLENPQPFIPILEDRYFTWPENRGYV